MHMKKIMIKFSLISQSNHWPARFKKINFIVNKILNYRKELNFRSNENYDCYIILSDNKLTKKMNYKFRKQKKSTDVLTFVSELNIKKKYKAKICNIFLSAETIKRDAHINKINFYAHLTHLLIHSFLHINGFTHKKKQDYDKMKNIEIKILKKLGISNPYLYN